MGHDDGGGDDVAIFVLLGMDVDVVLTVAK
jgi:hypothetical protein